MAKMLIQVFVKKDFVRDAQLDDKYDASIENLATDDVERVSYEDRAWKDTGGDLVIYEVEHKGEAMPTNGELESYIKSAGMDYYKAPRDIFGAQVVVKVLN